MYSKAGIEDQVEFVVNGEKGLASWHLSSAHCSERAVAKVDHNNNTLIKDKALNSHNASLLTARYLFDVGMLFRFRF